MIYKGIMKGGKRPLRRCIEWGYLRGYIEVGDGGKVIH